MRCGGRSRRGRRLCGAAICYRCFILFHQLLVILLGGRLSEVVLVFGGGLSFFLEPGQVDAADLVLTRSDTESGPRADRVQTAPHIPIRLNRCKGFHLTHFHAREDALLGDDETKHKMKLD